MVKQYSKASIDKTWLRNPDLGYIPYQICTWRLILSNHFPLSNKLSLKIIRSIKILFPFPLFVSQIDNIISCLPLISISQLAVYVYNFLHFRYFPCINVCFWRHTLKVLPYNWPNINLKISIH